MDALDCNTFYLTLANKSARLPHQSQPQLLSRRAFRVFILLCQLAETGIEQSITVQASPFHPEFWWILHVKILYIMTHDVRFMKTNRMPLVWTLFYYCLSGDKHGTNQLPTGTRCMHSCYHLSIFTFCAWTCNKLVCVTRLQHLVANAIYIIISSVFIKSVIHHIQCNQRGRKCYKSKKNYACCLHISFSWYIRMLTKNETRFTLLWTKQTGLYYVEWVIIAKHSFSLLFLQDESVHKNDIIAK